MVMMPSHIRRKRQKMALELAWLNMKKKLFGKLSARDEQRRQEIIKEFSVCY